MLCRLSRSKWSRTAAVPCLLLALGTRCFERNVELLVEQIVHPENTWRLWLQGGFSHSVTVSLQSRRKMSRPQLNQRLTKILGTPFSNGNLLFTENSVLSPVGNRVTLFDLVAQTTSTLPFETRKNIHHISVSHNGRFLILVDIEGAALFVNLPRRVVLQRFNFKRVVHSLVFSPDDTMFAVTFGRGCQIWRTPGIQREFCPLTLLRTLSGFHDDAVCVDWSDDSQSIIMGAKDLGAKIYYRVTSKRMAMTTLSGHRDILMGTYFSSSGDSAYTVARDGAVFTWTFQEGEREVVMPRKRAAEPSASDSDSDDDEEDEDGSDDDDGGNDGGVVLKTRRGGKWVLAAREFLWDPHTLVSSCAFNKKTNLLLVGFDQGVFGLYEMPGCVNLQRLSVSQQSLSTACINSTGEWMALGSSRLGQLLVWEWQSESYVLKQQGHLYGLNSLDYADDGHLIATGGEDSKVKLWNSSSGFCFMTFTAHVAPVTAVRFIGKGGGKAVLSASLDGTVRAHDLLRYKNFRTLTTPTPVQFTCLAADASGEVVCAGTLDPFSIYVWALQTGRLLDVLAGHEGPISCLEFNGSTLASGSWDGTLKLWDVYKNTCIETMEHGCDVLAVSFRPDGQEIACGCINGNVYVWDTESGEQRRIIEGRRDLAGGRLTNSAQSARSSDAAKCFTTLTYTADGSCILAGGRTKYACVYSASSGALVKKFQLSHNKSLEGISDEINSRGFVDGINVDALRGGGLAGAGTTRDAGNGELLAANTLPGAGKGSSTRDGSRSTRPELITHCLRFSPSGRDWAAATTQGLQLFSVDPALLFVPIDLDVTVTPQAVTQALATQQYPLALSFSLQLGEGDIIRTAVGATPIDAVPIVVRSLDKRLLGDLMRFLADELVTSRHMEFYLAWVSALMTYFGPFLQADPVPYQAALRSLVRAVGGLEREIQRSADDNHHTLAFLQTQRPFLEAALQQAAEAAEEQQGAGDEVVEVEVELEEAVQAAKLSSAKSPASSKKRAKKA